MATIIPGTSQQVVSAPSTTPDAKSASDGGGLDKDTIAGNFTTFLTLLTTQLKNQNPLDPLDTNQFTSQLVQFAGVEQQLKVNDQLSALVALQQTAQNSTALEFVGQKVGVAGDTAKLEGGTATWNLSVPKPVTGVVTISNATGQNVYTGTYSMNAGNSPFVWDGKDSSGLQWPDGNYKIAVVAQDASGQQVAVPTEIEAVVDSADLTQTPPVLSIAGQDYTLDKIKRVMRNTN